MFIFGEIMLFGQVNAALVPPLLQNVSLWPGWS